MAKIGHSEFYPTILVQKDWKKFRKVCGLHRTDHICIAAAETAVAITVTKVRVPNPFVCEVAIADVSGNGSIDSNVTNSFDVAIVIVQWERTLKARSHRAKANTSAKTM